MSEPKIRKQETEWADEIPDDEETDSWAYHQGYVAVTPLQLDMTAYDTMKKFESAYN